MLAAVQGLTAAPYNLTIPTIDRDFKLWSDVTAQPAVFVVEEGEAGEFVRGLPVKWTLDVSLWIYAQRDAQLPGMKQINPIIDAIAQLFGTQGQPPNQQVNTLGGLVYSCGISGKVEKNSGYLGEQAIALVPLKIVTV